MIARLIKKKGGYKVNFILMSVLLPIFGAAQSGHTLQGVTQDASGNPIPDAIVVITNDSMRFSKTILTSMDGSFNVTDLPIAGPYHLNFNLVGYASYDTSRVFAGALQRPIVLQTTNRSLDEVVVIGYGTQKKVSLTGAVDVVKSSAITDRPVTNVTQALQGTSPSLVIQNNSFEPGQTPRLNLRGVGTLGDNAPLVVIDGVVGGDINLLNPNDIESVSILKDAGSAAIYGSRSANGVILITTKKGRAGKTAINYNGIASLVHPKILVKPVPGYENMIYKNQALVNSGQLPSSSPLQIENQKLKGDDPWFLDELFHNSLQQNHNLSFSGGSEKTTYLISAGLLDQQNNLYGPAKGLKRYNFRMNLATTIGRLKLASNIAYAHTNIKDHSSNTGTLIVDAERTPPIYQYKDSLGRYLVNDVLTEFNPFGVLDQQGYRKYDNENFFGTIKGDLKLTSNLTLTGMFGVTLDANHMFYKYDYSPFYRVGTPVGGLPVKPESFVGNSSSTGDQNTKNWRMNTQLLLQYNKSFGLHDLNLMGGYTGESYTGKFNQINMQYVSNDLGLPGTYTVINVGDQTVSPQSTNQNSLNSFIGRATYNYDERYFGEINFRADGSSKFAKNNRWGYFPSFSGSWLISNENFFKNGKIANTIDVLKLRATYGILGNQNVGNYQYQTTYFVFANAYGFNNNAVSGAGFNTANPDIRWETAKIFNIGTDITLLDRKLNVTFDAFHKRTDNILQQPNLPGTFGGANVDFNIASVKNTGWELTVNYNIVGENWRHSIGFNMGDTKNEILKLGNDQTRIQSSDEMQVIYAKGLPIGSYVGLKRDGYFQNLDDINNKARFVGLDVGPGDVAYKDKNGDGIIDDNDRYILGNPFPRYTFGFNYTVGYKNVDLVLFVQGVGKRSQFIRGELVEPYHANYSYNLFEHQRDFWTPANPNAEFPRLAVPGSASNTNNYRKASNIYLFNAAYARLKNVQIGYSLPQKMTSRLGIQKMRAFLSGQNLFTIAANKFVDPESTEFDGNLGVGGANSARNYPTTQYYGFGLDITF